MTASQESIQIPAAIQKPAANRLQNWQALGICALAGLVILGHWLVFNRTYDCDLDDYYRRAYQFAEIVREGTLYPRWMGQAFRGLGSPDFIFYGPVYNYAVAAIASVTGNIWAAMKIAAWLANVAAGFATFLFLRQLQPSFRWSLAAALVVQLAPFPMMILTHVGGMPFYFCFPFVIIAVLAAATHFQRPAGIDLPMALTLALAALTHILVAWMLVLSLVSIAVTYGWIQRRQLAPALRRIAGFALSGGLGLALSAVFVYPALAAVRLISVGQYDQVLDWRACFILPLVTSHLFGKFWFSMQWILPASLLLCLVAASLVLYRHRSQPGPTWIVLLMLTVLGWWTLFLASEASYGLWVVLQPLRRLATPTRLVLILTASALPASLIACAIQPSNPTPCLLRRVLLLAPLSSCLLTLLLIITTSVHGGSALEIISREHAPQRKAAGVGPFLPVTAGNTWRQYIDNGGWAAECRAQGVDYRVVSSRSHHRIWVVHPTRNATLRLPVFAFPAWRLTVDDRPTEWTTDPDTGLIRFTAQPGEQRVELKWDGLPEDRVGAAISLVALVLVGALKCQPLVISRRQSRSSSNSAAGSEPA